MKKLIFGAILLLLVSCSTTHIVYHTNHNENLLEAISTFATDSTELYIPENLKSQMTIISENKNLVHKQK